MIDIENEVIDIVYKKLTENYPNVQLDNQYERNVNSMPLVVLIEEDNAVYTQSSDNNIENHAQVMYQLDVYSNKQDTAKLECKEIFKFVDSVLADIGFTRTLAQPMPNLADSTIYRMTARYTAVVSKDKEIFKG